MSHRSPVGWMAARGVSANRPAAATPAPGWPRGWGRLSCTLCAPDAFRCQETTNPRNQGSMPRATTAVDLRSDTVTRPTSGMRRAIAEAVVGDDVFGDDPTVQELEHRVARLAAKQAALYVPSGTMGNQLAVASQTRPGDEVLLEVESHIFLYEQAGIAANSGTLAHPLASERGVIEPAAIGDATREQDDDDDHVAKIRLLCLENTHNRHGGS